MNTIPIRKDHPLYKECLRMIEESKNRCADLIKDINVDDPGTEWKKDSVVSANNLIDDIHRFILFKLDNLIEGFQLQKTLCNNAYTAVGINEMTNYKAKEYLSHLDEQHFKTLEKFKPALLVELQEQYDHTQKKLEILSRT